MLREAYNAIISILVDRFRRVFLCALSTSFYDSPACLYILGDMFKTEEYKPWSVFANVDNQPTYRWSRNFESCLCFHHISPFLLRIVHFPILNLSKVSTVTFQLSSINSQVSTVEVFNPCFFPMFTY
jgi:hypothetical protein